MTAKSKKCFAFGCITDVALLNSETSVFAPITFNVTSVRNESWTRLFTVIVLCCIDIFNGHQCGNIFVVLFKDKE